MPTLNITIKMDNAAFDDDPMNEVARILRTLARDVTCFGGFERLILRDINGNPIGEAKVTGRRSSKILAALLALSLLAASPALACQGGGGSGASGSGGSSGSSAGSSGDSSTGSAGGDGGSGGYEPGPFPLPIPCGGVFLPWCKAESQTVEPIQ